ncbi:tRNA lysidine(34) synthetase TilS [Paenibacillus glycanilyticus]|uniref:tRNA lysidine(34) synthetase TilS n=1 Tax=Paenibacillus glycanilyticus TaxID=126569 RepID=UPI00203A74A0|nr:tRNA lysidine(34) synthetase TilS [Paenibacillus glycanilyticus]MCM3631336.1 tRNA lysidine(34) synthetase TilS [Paenibacillus glycanilyticus]
METGDHKLPTEMMKFAAAEQLWSKGDRIVAAVSGGPDSMALLHMLCAAAQQDELTVIAAHVNHGFRKEASRQEAEIVRQYAAKLGVSFEMIELDMPAYIEETGMNAQSAAREKRYAFLHEAAHKYRASAIALAHHADDQAETVLMRIIRGAGLTGLAGMAAKRQEKNVELIRPLLRMNKSDIVDYCSGQSIPYCHDSSNNERYYFRNVVRLDVLPYLSQFNPQLTHSLRRIADVAGAEDDWMELEAQKLFASLATSTPDECKVDVSMLHGLHVALQRRLIKLILNYLSKDAEIASFDAIETMRLAAAPAAPSTWRYDAGSGVRCIREYGSIRWVRVLSAAITPEAGYAYPVSRESEKASIAAGGRRLHIERQKRGEAVKPAGRSEVCFDADQLVFPLTVRNRQPGDRIQVLGLNGSKKVQDMFVDEKIAPSERERYPLLVDAEGRLLWIPGIRRSSHALTGHETTDFLFIRMENE